MRAFDLRRLANDERGEGPMTVVFYIIVVGIIWVVVNFLIGYLYDTKEERKDPGHHKGKKGRIVTTTFVAKEPGSYTVEYDK